MISTRRHLIGALKGKNTRSDRSADQRIVAGWRIIYVCDNTLPHGSTRRARRGAYSGPVVGGVKSHDSIRDA